MRYSIKPKDRIYVKGHGFLSFAKSMSKNLSNNLKTWKSLQQMQQKLLHKKNKTWKLPQNDSETAEAVGDSIGNKIADEIISISKFPKKLHSQIEDEIEIPKEISPEKRQQIIDELRLV